MAPELSDPPGSASDEPDDRLVAGPDQARASRERDRHLADSRQAVGPLHVADYLQQRPSRRSGLSAADALRLYHRDRFRSRGTEALTPGADVWIALLPIVAHQAGKWAFVAGAFATTSAEMLYSPSYSLLEKHVWTYLLNHRCFDTFRRTGEAVVASVAQADVAASAGVSTASVSRAVKALEAKGRLTSRKQGLGRPNVYTLALYESGASAYPAGHPRSARKRVEALVTRAVGDRRSAEALFLQTTLGFRIDGLSADSLVETVWRRLDRAVAELGGAAGCPHRAHR